MKEKAKKKKKKSLYLLVSSDKYSLPLAVADSAEELGLMIGVNPTNIYSCISHAMNDGAGKRKKKRTSRYIRVDF